MAFTGTQTKCKVCGKTVYLMEQLIADGAIYHKSCFRCAHCKGTLKLNNYASLEGVVYCKPHFEQLFKQTGSYTRSFDETIKAEKEKPPPPESVTSTVGISKFSGGEKKTTTNPLASRFGGTQDKCKVCNKTVYPLDKVAVEGTTYHNSCFKCSHGGCKLNTATFRAYQGKLYCTHHFQQLFLKKGNFSELQKENGDGLSVAETTKTESKASTASASEEPATTATPAPTPAAVTSAASPAKIEKPQEKPPAKKDDDDDDDSDDDDSDDDDSDDDDD